jgi:Lrp/AsnC family leucine-responsive transcriptional regulator
LGEELSHKKTDLDSVDIKLLELLLKDGRMTFKELGKRLSIDERLAARRVERLESKGVIRGFTTAIDWSKLGLTTEVWVGTRTGVGRELREKLFDFIERNPNIVEAAAAVGTYEYVFHAICGDLYEFRTQIGTPLEPLTAGLSTSIMTETVKHFDVKPLLQTAFQKLVTGGT